MHKEVCHESGKEGRKKKPSGSFPVSPGQARTGDGRQPMISGKTEMEITEARPGYAVERLY